MSSWEEILASNRHDYLRAKMEILEGLDCILARLRDFLDCFVIILSAFNF